MQSKPLAGSRAAYVVVRRVRGSAGRAANARAIATVNGTMVWAETGRPCDRAPGRRADPLGALSVPCRCDSAGRDRVARGRAARAAM
jgi:hypothetical protein